MRSGVACALLAVFCAGAVGCLAPPGDGELDSMGQEIVNGIPTDEHPAIGIITRSGCTATLVTPRVILTAAHCVDFQTGPRSDGFLTGRGEAFGIDFVISRSDSAPGAFDLAVARLTSPVPSSSAVPLPVTPSEAGFNDDVTVYGYGCIDRANPSLGYGTKRKFTYKYGFRFSFQLLCPGDSGGPVLYHRGVFLVNSGHFGDGGDIFANVAHAHSWFTSAVGALGG